MSVLLRFPGDRLATFTCSLGAADVSAYRLVGTKGTLRMDPVYEYAQPLRQEVVIDTRKRTRTFPKRDQFAPDLLHFSSCILDDREPEPSGREGMNDMCILEAIAPKTSPCAADLVEPADVGTSMRVRTTCSRRPSRASMAARMMTSARRVCSPATAAPCVREKRDCAVHTSAYFGSPRS